MIIRGNFRKLLPALLVVCTNYLVGAQDRIAPETFYANSYYSRYNTMPEKKAIGKKRVIVDLSDLSGYGLDTSKVIIETLDENQRLCTRCELRYLSKAGEFESENPEFELNVIPTRLVCQYNKKRQLINYSLYAVGRWDDSKMKFEPMTDSLMEKEEYLYDIDGNLIYSNGGKYRRASYYSYTHRLDGRVTKRKQIIKQETCDAPSSHYYSEEIIYNYTRKGQLASYIVHYRNDYDTTSPFTDKDNWSATFYHYNSKGDVDSTSDTYGVNISSRIVTRKGKYGEMEVSRHDYQRNPNREADTIITYSRNGKIDSIIYQSLHFESPINHSKCIYLYDKKGRKKEMSMYTIGNQDIDRRLLFRSLYFYEDN